MSGIALEIPYTPFVSPSQSMCQTPQLNVDIIRSFTRFKSMFIPFYVDATTTSTARAYDETRLIHYSNFCFKHKMGSSFRVVVIQLTVVYYDHVLSFIIRWVWMRICIHLAMNYNGI